MVFSYNPRSKDFSTSGMSQSPNAPTLLGYRISRATAKAVRLIFWKYLGLGKATVHKKSRVEKNELRSTKGKLLIVRGKHGAGGGT